MLKFNLKKVGSNWEFYLFINIIVTLKEISDCGFKARGKLGF